jgi:2-keto-4-pentenoate hydratase
VRELGIAIEVVDLDPPADTAPAVLGRNVYHRFVLLGPERATSFEGLRARVLRDGVEIASTDDVGALNGDPRQAGAVVARALPDELRDGEVVIAGSVVPPVRVRPGERYRYELDPVGALELAFA